ncbi:glutamate-cysteine ligase family protein [Mycobacterium kiyosense]
MPGWVWCCWAPTRYAGERVNRARHRRAAGRFFVAGNTAAAGAAMMTSTASIRQPRRGTAGQVGGTTTAGTLGPTMIAITANSPLLRGKFSGWVSTRQQVWGRLGSARCGPIQQADCEDPASSWARYAQCGDGACAPTPSRCGGVYLSPIGPTAGCCWAGVAPTPPTSTTT